VQRVGAPEADVARQPRGGADVDVRLAVAHRAGAHRGRHRVGRACDHRRAGGEAESARRLLGERAEDAVGGQELRQLGAVESGRADQALVPGDAVQVARVSEPVQRGGDRRRGRTAGEAQAEPVDGLEQQPGVGVDLGAHVAQVEDVAERIATAQGRRAAGAAQPAREPQRSVARNPHRSARRAPDERGPARVHPDEGVAERLAVRADGNGARPLGGDGHGSDVVVAGAGGEPPARRGGGAPPLVGRLLDPATGKHAQPDRLALPIEHAPVGE
jgi:hypothetical protein